MLSAINKPQVFATSVHMLPRALVSEALCVLLVIGLMLGSAKAIYSALEIGNDEHYEVTKAMLWSKGFKPYTDFWNDQPPVLTAITGLLFKLVGPHILAARLINVTFALLFVIAMLHIVRKCSGVLASIISVVCVLTAPRVFVLCISNMLEMPAFAIALCALWPLQTWKQSKQCRYLLLSAVLFGVALQTKLTAVLLLPALLLEIGVYNPRLSLLWCAAAGATFLCIGETLGNSLSQALASHFTVGTAAESVEMKQNAFVFGVIMEHPEGILGLLTALLVSFSTTWQTIRFPVILLLTAFAVHLLHRPYWPYYYLHFAIPVGWLTGHAVAALFKRALDQIDKTRSLWNHVCLLSVPCILAAIVVTLGGTRLTEQIQAFSQLKIADKDPLLARMRSFSSRTRWVYTRDTIYPFYANLNVIPSLAVIPKKRFWSHQISQSQIFEAIKAYKPEQILLSQNTKLEPDAMHYVLDQYHLAFSDPPYSLLVRNDLVTLPP